MPALPDLETILTLLRQATEKVRAATARTHAAEARAARIAAQVRPLLDRVEAELRAAADRVAAARREAAEAQARQGAAEAMLAVERERVRRLEAQLAGMEAQLTQIRTALAEGASPAPRTDREAGSVVALH
ncbi:hypothetical protein [Methylobacterium sp. ID0610]|uniref:hypothetical protein n=1 Tax=Methylobacterium carpenticola TaxID=3344827 RepID=UPI003690C133